MRSLLLLLLIRDQDMQYNLQVLFLMVVMMMVQLLRVFTKKLVQFILFDQLQIQKDSDLHWIH